jgi:DNA invertase Pin-like site-specific DNA recombinase
MDAELFSKRVKRGMRAARRRGVRLGRPPLKFDRVKVCALALCGLSIRRIAKKLRIKKSTAHNVLLKRYGVSRNGWANR